jgi:hypothetical protein
VPEKLSQADLVAEARRIVSAAVAADVTVRLLGGVAVRLHCPSTAEGAPFARPINDIDLIGLGRDSGRIKQVFVELGYAPHRHFNAVHGRRRLLFQDHVRALAVDVFLDQFIMCHTFDFRRRLAADTNGLTLSPADLLFTKLQIVELNDRDIRDILALICDHELSPADAPETIDVSHIVRLCARDWGLEKTCLHTLEWARSAVEQQHLEDPRLAERARQRLSALAAAIAGQPKTYRWRLRAIIGERLPWYELPEKPIGR